MTKTLNEILSVFQNTKQDLETFMTEKSSDISDLHAQNGDLSNEITQNLNSIRGKETEILKAEKVMKQVQKFL